MRHLQDLMKWREPGSPKKQCQIHKSPDARASRTIARSRPIFIVLFVPCRQDILPCSIHAINAH
jgi:hypothetical protein